MKIYFFNNSYGVAAPFPPLYLRHWTQVKSDFIAYIRKIWYIFSSCLYGRLILGQSYNRTFWIPWFKPATSVLYNCINTICKNRLCGSTFQHTLSRLNIEGTPDGTSEFYCFLHADAHLYEYLISSSYFHSFSRVQMKTSELLHEYLISSSYFHSFSY